MLQAIVFDSDGTLFPTSKRQEKWFKYWSEINNKPWPFEDFAQFMNFYNTECGKKGGVQNVYDTLNLPCDMKDKSHPVWPAYEKFNQNNPAAPYPEMLETIKTLWDIGSIPKDLSRNMRIKLGINTTNSWGSISRDVDSSGMRPYFDAIIAEEILAKYHGDGNPETLKKPSTISLALILGLLDSEGNSTIHVGDTRNDLKASQKVMRLNPNRPETLITIGACYGYEGRNILEQGVETPHGLVKFDYLIDKPSELIPIVKILL